MLVRTFVILIAIQISLFMTNNSMADFKDGNDVLRDCTSDNMVQGSFCYGYVDAIADVLASRNNVNGITSCIPRSVTTMQLKDIVVQFMILNPTLRHYGASGIVARAISEAFHCR